MTVFSKMLKRNTKLFFKDKGLFFTSLITPMILLVLYVSFLGNVYSDSLLSALPEGFTLSDKLLKGFTGAQLISSILSVSCVTVAFCSNMLMVQDKANGQMKDIAVSPAKSHTLALSYYFGALISTLTVCFAATAVCLVYIAFVGWYLSFADVVLLITDVLIMTMFGTSLSSIVNFFLSSQGQISAVGTIVSSGYGFISGAYMPLSQFSEGLQKVVSLLPGTFGTVLFRNHAMRGVLSAMEDDGLPKEFISELRDVFDCNLYVFDKAVGTGGLYAVILGTVAVLIGVYVLLNYFKLKSAKR